MKTINDYTIHCTKEQTKLAMELGAPIELKSEVYYPNGAAYPTNPTAEQMIGWLETQGFDFEVCSSYSAVDYKSKGCLGIYGGERKETVLIVIDKALDYLINKKK